MTRRITGKPTEPSGTCNMCELTVRFEIKDQTEQSFMPKPKYCPFCGYDLASRSRELPGV